MLNKEFFFQGKSVIRKIKDKAFFDFVVAHLDDKNITYTPIGVYSYNEGNGFVNIVRVDGGSIPMTFHLEKNNGYISDTDWMMLFRKKEKSDYDELLRRLNDYNNIVNSSKNRLDWQTVDLINTTQKALKNFVNEMSKKI